MTSKTTRFRGGLSGVNTGGKKIADGGEHFSITPPLYHHLHHHYFQAKVSVLGVLLTTKGLRRYMTTMRAG